MSAKKLILAMAICYVVLVGTNWLIHQVWLMNDYLATPDSWRPMADLGHKMWVMLVGQAFFAALFCYIYSRGAEAKPWLAQGIRYGILITMFFVIPSALSEYTVYRVPHMLAVKWMIAGCIQMIILGLIVAGICQKQAA
ncbi:MAG TPA: hypothetical protein VGR72_06165 [Candidatus Acidoferrales bacterium]|nr:hypothetical protein [Candidatus Acidoferrales bacterium]